MAGHLPVDDEQGQMDRFLLDGRPRFQVCHHGCSRIISLKHPIAISLAIFFLILLHESFPGTLLISRGETDDAGVFDTKDKEASATAWPSPNYALGMPRGVFCVAIAVFLMPIQFFPDSSDIFSNTSIAERNNLCMPLSLFIGSKVNMAEHMMIS